MIAGVYFAGAPFAGVLKAAGASAAALAGAASITVSSLGTLDPPPQYLAAAATITVTTAATMDNPPADLAGAATIVWTTRGDLVVPIETTTGITIDGIDVTGRVRIAGVTIRDVLNDAPNTLSFTLEGTAPAVGQRVRFTMGPRLMFAGAIQTVDQAFELQPQYLAWAVTVIDDTAEANARRPFGTYLDVSATTIAETITAQCAPGFSTAGIEAGLPPVRMVFDGADTFIAALARLATAVGGYCKITDRTVYLFTEDTSDPPNPISDAFPFLHDPPITINTDSSQLRTRVYGKGYGETVTADLVPGATQLPIQNGAQFPPGGGLAIVSLTADGAQSDRIAFAGVVLQTGGSLVGLGFAPSTAPGVSLATGSGVESGAHDYAYAFVTPSGRTLPGPAARIIVGTVPGPATAPAAALGAVGGGLDLGSHRYYAAFRTATGATLAGPVSNGVTVTQVTAPTAIGGITNAGGGGVSNITPNAEYWYRYTFYRDADGAETTPSSLSGIVTNSFGSSTLLDLAGCQAAPAGYRRRWYRTAANGGAGGAYKRVAETPAEDVFHGSESGGFFMDGSGDGSRQNAAPTVNSTKTGVCQLSSIPVSSSPVVTHVDLYREFNSAGGPTARLAVSVTNATTTATDTVANASLGALVPATSTASANRVTVTWPAGPAGSTNIEIYRTPAGSAQLKLVHTVGSNTAGTTTDATPDASLGANAPAGDTSGLTQSQGQVNPGAAVLPVASATPFRPGGGWVLLAGDQVVWHSGISGNTLTGIPATGSGAITTAVVYGSQAIPSAMLNGVTGLTRPMAKGSAVHLWVQRDDLLAQAEHAARTGGDGVVEYLIVDQRRGLDSLTARCDADLALFSRPIVTVAYATRDLQTASGKPIVIDLPSQGIQQTLTIQDVTITEIDIVPGLAPRFTVKASSVRFSLEDTLRRLIAAGPTAVKT